MFSELPEAEKVTTKLFLFNNVEKIYSGATWKSRSFEIAENKATFDVRHMLLVLTPILFFICDRSAEKCSAVEALPPLPAVKINPS
jgi:hypothetical protein